ncbi:MAG: Ribosome LSU-associated GTP-binding protein HflX [uncultured Thermoleophilia bacterium]|uniref:GTPase HflX n=1 Tax=uncultured Thermoleophilia bacterium TaxID=1497501 RepID=A0A6J4UEQ5_9ACTN|nr:MAG: Ribosome LSU-associated GTP-binding protein HflX [uncultured Thermoleophilia bacterium]
MPDAYHTVRDDDPERGVIVAILPQGVEEDALDEVRELLATAGVETVAVLTQRRGAAHPRTYLGPGKLDELKERVRDVQAEVVVCDDELTPRQQRTLEDALGMRVVDRTAVILDIFALHAHSAEGKLQVELAQLEYNLQRMRGLWQHLERLGGGVGTRGPGESQLETDRRLARDRVNLIKRRLKDTSRHRVTMRRRRVTSEVPAVALAGYTNVGKSTLLNALTGSEVSTANRLFETLDPTTRAYTYNGRAYTLTDTVGFIRKLPHGLVEAFTSTLEETLAGDLILHVTDASAPEEEWREQYRAVEDVLEQIGAGELPRLLVLNKIDRLDPLSRRRVRNAHPDAVLVSAQTGEGLEALEERIAVFFAGRFEPVELLVPHGEGAVLSALYALGQPLEREDTDDGVVVRAHLPEAESRRYAAFRVDPAPRAEVPSRAAAEATAGRSDA